jgi:hypothetical protein
MAERLAIELPAGVGEEARDELVASLQDIEEVDAAENLGPSRSVDLETISIGVQLAAQIGGLAGPVVKRIVGLIRGRDIKGVELSLPDGTTIAVDEISSEDLDHLLERMGK